MEDTTNFVVLTREEHCFHFLLFPFLLFWNCRYFVCFMHVCFSCCQNMQNVMLIFCNCLTTTAKENAENEEIYESTSVYRLMFVEMWKYKAIYTYATVICI